jgi:hypothetical protein
MSEKAFELALPIDRKFDGKAMAALPDRQRQFVQAMLRMGVNPKAAASASLECGFHKNYGYELMRDDGVLAALREESTKRLVGAALVGVNVMLEIAQNPLHKDQYRAAKELAAINGFTAEQRIVVEHINPETKDQIRQIRDMAKEMKMDPEELFRKMGIVDAEFEEVIEVIEVQVDDSDW